LIGDYRDGVGFGRLRVVVVPQLQLSVDAPWAGFREQWTVYVSLGVVRLTRNWELSMMDTPNRTKAHRGGFVIPSRPLRLAAGLCAVAFLSGLSFAAQAQNTRTAAVAARPIDATPAEPSAVAKPGSRLAGRYFVDFRARTAASYGHAFLWYGRLNSNGRVGAIEVAGLHPASDSVIPYILGHIMPVPSETGKSYGDLDEQYLTANYRVYLTDADAKKVFAFIQHKQASSPLWMNGVYNCTAFVADIAAYMGLRTPAFTTLTYPENFINELKRINGGRQEVRLAGSQ
jgi:hypothetical protein